MPGVFEPLTIPDMLAGLARDQPQLFNDPDFYKKWRRSQNIEDQRPSPLWEDYNNSVLADLFGTHEEKVKYWEARPEGMTLPQSDSPLANQAGMRDLLEWNSYY